MSQNLTGAHDSAAAEMVVGLRDEFVGDLADDIQDMEKRIGEALADPGKAAALTDALRQFAFDTKGQSHNFDLMLINTVARRMDDYLAGIEVLGTSGLIDAQSFIDVINDILNGEIPEDEDPSLLVRRLPARPAVNADLIETREAEILLVMLHGAATKKVQRELQECGYRVSIVTSTCEALPTILRTKPDLVVISAVMAELSGIDLAIALKAMPVTRNVPVSLITSFGRDHDDLYYLPDGVPIIQKGRNFPDDIAATLEYHFLI